MTYLFTTREIDHLVQVIVVLKCPTCRIVSTLAPTKQPDKVDLGKSRSLSCIEFAQKHVHLVRWTKCRCGSLEDGVGIDIYLWQMLQSVNRVRRYGMTVLPNIARDAFVDLAFEVFALGWVFGTWVILGGTLSPNATCMGQICVLHRVLDGLTSICIIPCGT